MLQAGIIIARRSINNLTYADETILIPEREDKLKSLLIKLKEETEKSGLKINIQKMKIMASGPITSWLTDSKKVDTVADFIFLGSIITADGDCSHEIKRRLLLGIKKQRHHFANKGLYSQDGFSRNQVRMREVDH